MKSNIQLYLPSNARDSLWGISVTTIGSQSASPGDPYPIGPHPEGHRLNDETGRVLDEYQVLLISAGRGTLWSESAGTSRIEAGTVFFNFKGVRHLYRPDPDTGWVEYWIGLKGTYIEHLMEKCFDPSRPLVKVGNDPELIRLYQESFDLANLNDVGCGRIVATKALQILAKAERIQSHVTKASSYKDNVIRAACCEMNAAIEKPFSSLAFANMHGMSLTSFRRHFKLVTGVSPLQYLLELRLRKAQNLLSNHNLSIKRIAIECGFNNALYFSRFYKSRTGSSPKKARR